MDIRQLRSFVAVAEYLSFTKAADRLGYAQSTVTAHVRGLEREFDVVLFHRGSHGIALSPDGRRLLDYAGRVLELTNEVRESLHPDTSPSGSLVVGTMESLTSYRMLPVLEHLHLRYPGITVRLRPSLCADTAQAVRDGTMDCGFVIDVPREFPGLHSESLCTEPLTLIAAPHDPIAGASSLDLPRLRQARVLGTEPGCAYRDHLQSLLTEEGDTPFPILELGTVESVKHSAATGMGIALLPRVTVAQELADGELVSLPWCPPFELTTQALWRRGERNSEALRVLLDVARRTTAEYYDDRPVDQ